MNIAYTSVAAGQIAKNKIGALITPTLANEGVLQVCLNKLGLITQSKDGKSVSMFDRYNSQTVDSITLPLSASVDSLIDKLLGGANTDFNSETPQTSGSLIVGKTYTLTTLVQGDSFSNVDNIIISGLTNTTGCVFIATGTTPTVWINGSIITPTYASTAKLFNNGVGVIDSEAGNKFIPFSSFQSLRFKTDKAFLITGIQDPINRGQGVDTIERQICNTAVQVTALKAALAF